MKTITSIVILFFMGSNISAYAQVNSNVAAPDALPDIAELPVLNLSDTSLKPIQTVERSDVLIRDVPSQRTDGVAIEDGIPTAQQELIERLKYKKKEGSKIKRYKPDVRISVSDNDATNAWKNKD